MAIRTLVVRSAGAVKRGVAAARRPSGVRPTEDPALFRPMVYGDPDRLHVHPTAVVNNAGIEQPNSPLFSGVETSSSRAAK
jgi:hypothetical protein